MPIVHTLQTRAALLLALLVALSACGQAAPGGSPSSGGALVPVLAVSELGLGPNRIALGVLQDGTPLNLPDLRLGMRFFYLDGDEDTTVQSESAAVYRGQGLPFGLYVGYATFDRPGNWSVEISIPRDGGSPQVANMRLDVRSASAIPTVGQPAVPSENLTVRDNPDLGQITSDISPDPDFYQMTVAEAIAAKKPFVVGFITPGYCQTAVCGPNMAVLKKLKGQFKDRLNFIHVEVYLYPFGESFQQQRRVPSMVEWGLVTEPWTFLVDAEGVIQYRYEGGITFDEMQPALEQLAAGQAVTPLAAP
jgi:hypothetical protein